MNRLDANFGIGFPSGANEADPYIPGLLSEGVEA
jgi:hypothetical protein